MRVAAGTVAVLLCAVACSPDGGGDLRCTLIGANSGMTVQLHHVLTPHPGERFDVTTCVDSECPDHVVRGRAAGKPVEVGFGVDSVTDGSPRMASVTVKDASGRILFDGQSEVRPELVEPNGPECDPHVWVALLRAVGSDRLNVITLPE